MVCGAVCVQHCFVVGHCVAFLPRFFLGAGWKGDQSYLFDERINATNEFETQAYTSLMQVGDNAAYVVYNK